MKALTMSHGDSVTLTHSYVLQLVYLFFLLSKIDFKYFEIMEIHEKCGLIVHTFRIFRYPNFDII